MGVKKRSRDKWSIRFRFEGEDVAVVTDARLKSEAERIEKVVKSCIRYRRYEGLRLDERDALVRLFNNRGWRIPEQLIMPNGTTGSRPLVERELLLWKAIEICMKSPAVRKSSNKERNRQAFIHITQYFGKNFPVKSLWIPEIQEYMAHRASKGASGSTINKEKAALSRMFQVLMEYRHLDVNPAKMVKSADGSTGEREIYISYKDFMAAVDELSAWLQPIIFALYLSGMRRGELLGLTWDNVDLAGRMIRLTPDQTKENKKKRVPIHRLLVPVLERAGKIRSLSTGKVFLGEAGTIPPSVHSLRLPWIAAAKKAGINPAPTVHDIRHVWAANAMRSGIGPRISEAIMGHAWKKKDVQARYIQISDESLIQAIDMLTFNNGDTKIWLADAGKKEPQKDGDLSGDFKNRGQKRGQSSQCL